MDLTAGAGIITIVGSMMYILAVVPLSGAYGGRDPDEVLAHIRAHRRGYVLSQVLFAIGAVVTGVGMALLAVPLADARGPLLPVLGAIAILLGGVMWVVLSYDRTVNYERFFREYGTFPISAWSWLVLTGAGLAIYGYLFLAPGFPAWVGYATWVLIALQVAGAIFFPKQVPPQIYYLATLMIGVTALAGLLAGVST